MPSKVPESNSVFIHPRFVPQYSPFESLLSPHPCEEVLYYARFAKNETQLQSALVNILRHFESWTTPLEYSCHGCRKTFPTLSPSPKGSVEEQDKLNTRYRCIDCEKIGKDVDFCTECRRQGNNHDNTHVFQPYKTTTEVSMKDETDRRHALISFGVLQFAFSELRSTTPVHEDKTVLLLWRLIFRLAFNANAEDELAYGPTLEAVEEGLIEAFVMEATRVPLRLKIASIALSPMTIVCLRKECVPALIRTGAVDCFVKMSLLPISEEKEQDQQDTSLQIVSHAISCLRNLALHPECRFVLLEKGAVNAAVSLISANLASKDAVRINIGFLCASLICRLVGNEEVDSPAAKIIRSNVQVIQEYETRLSNILLHPDKNAQWNPANLVYDISILAKSDKNKPLLKRFIPLIVTGFEQRAKRNSRFVMFGINTLSLLWFDETCRPALNECYDRLIHALDEILQLESTSMETNRTAQVLRGSLVEWKQNQQPQKDREATSEHEEEEVKLMAGGPDDDDDGDAHESMPGGLAAPPQAARIEFAKAPSAKRMGRIGGLPTGGGRSGKGSFRMFSRMTSSNAVINNKQRESSGAHLAVKHAMISYSWDCNPEIAETMELLLRDAGIPTWFDKNDMGENINDSMADAIERAFVVLILYSEAYKESGNCRREADMADELKRPKIFIRVQDGYEGNGWLRLMMGKSLWIDCSSMDRLEKNKNELVKRVARASHGLIAPPPNSPTAASSNGGVIPLPINKTTTTTTATKPASSFSLLMRGTGKGGSQSTLQTSNNRASGDFAKNTSLVNGEEGLLLLVLKQLQSDMKEMKTEMQSIKGEIAKLNQHVVDSHGKN